jgi:uncharacterized protein
MEQIVNKLVFGRSRSEKWVMGLLFFILVGGSIWFAINFVNPSPPSKLVIATGDGEGDYAAFAQKYAEAMKAEGIHLQIRETKGTVENVRLLKDPKSDVAVAFVHDGYLSQNDAPDLSSLGSMYFEPLWIFVSNKPEFAKAATLTQLIGKKIAVGEKDSGTEVLATRLLNNSGVTTENSHFINMNWHEIQEGLNSGKIDVAFFMSPAEDDLIEELLKDSKIKLLSIDNAEALQRRMPFLHHLTLPHGSINIAKNLPEKDIEIVAPTATLLAKKSIHPALVHLLLKAATKAHSDASILEKANEFPADKDYEFDLNEDARQYYKNGAPAWHRYLPFWLATLLERFLVVAVPFFAVIIPAIRMIPRFFNWRARRKILSKYAQLKYIEVALMALGTEVSRERINQFLKDLKKIETAVDNLRVPLEFAEQVYGLRANIKSVRDRILESEAHSHLIEPRATV